MQETYLASLKLPPLRRLGKLFKLTSVLPFLDAVCG